MQLIDLDEGRDRRMKMLLDTATNIGELSLKKRELDLKEKEADPQQQAMKLASMLSLMGNVEGAQKVIESVGAMNKGNQVQLPSQIPNYMGGVVGPSVGTSVGSPGGFGVVGGTVSPKGSSFRVGPQALSEADKANMRIQEDLTKKSLEQSAGANKILGMEDVYLKQYARSSDELNKYDPDIGRTGAGGWASRNFAKVLNKMDEFPETKALGNLSKPIAQEIATSLEGRATDEDRKVQLDLLANVLSGPTDENIRTASLNLQMIKAKGGDIKPYLEKLSKSKIPILKKIADAVYKDMPELSPTKIDLDNLFEGV